MHARLYGSKPYADFFFPIFSFFFYMVHSDTSTVLVPVLLPYGPPGVSETGVGTFTCLFWLSARALSMMCRGQSVGGCEAQKCDRQEEEVCFIFSFPHLPEGFCCSHAFEK